MDDGTERALQWAYSSLREASRGSSPPNEDVEDLYATVSRIIERGGRIFTAQEPALFEDETREATRWEQARGWASVASGSFSSDDPSPSRLRDWLMALPYAFADAFPSSSDEREEIATFRLELAAAARDAARLVLPDHAVETGAEDRYIPRTHRLPSVADDGGRSVRRMVAGWLSDAFLLDGNPALVACWNELRRGLQAKDWGRDPAQWLVSLDEGCEVVFVPGTPGYRRYLVLRPNVRRIADEARAYLKQEQRYTGSLGRRLRWWWANLRGRVRDMRSRGTA